MKHKKPTIIGAWTSCALLLLLSMGYSQTFTPVAYWQFENPHPTLGDPDVIGNHYLNPGLSTTSQFLTGGPVNGHMEIIGPGEPQNNTLVSGGTFGYTVEFLLKPSSDFVGGYMIESNCILNGANGCPTGRQWSFQLNPSAYANNPPYLRWYTYPDDESTASVLIVPLDGTGRKNICHYLDGNWHHFALVYDGQAQTMCMYVDGLTDPSFCASVPNKPIEVADRRLYLAHGSANAYRGTIDEMAIWEDALPAAMVYQHYQEFQAGNHYGYQQTNFTVPPTPSTSGSLEPLEFAPGFTQPTVSAYDQLKAFPAARYLEGNSLAKNFVWFSLDRLTNHLSSYSLMSPTEISQLTELQEEYAKHWNYNLWMGNSLLFNPTDLGNPSTLLGSFVQLANNNPDLPLSATTYWAQVKPNIAPSCVSSSAFVTRNNLTPAEDHYFVDRTTNPPTVLFGGMYSYVGNQAPLNCDGDQQDEYLSALTGALTRPLNFINENGEVDPLPRTYSSVANDFDVINDFNSTTMSWETYQANRKNLLGQAYTSRFLPGVNTHNLSLGGDPVDFTWYAVDAGPFARFDYEERRKIQTQRNGQYYATPDFYPRYPSNWKRWSGAWRGWEWIAESRNREIALGDKLFSPFVAAGWSADATINVRPGQWLGLLKGIGALGAEFYYPFQYHSGTAHNADAWCWQSVIPSYAQAITSRYEEILRHGEVLEGDLKTSRNNPMYSFNTGKWSDLVVVRKFDDNGTIKYLITGNINTWANVTEDADAERVVSVTVDNEVVSFPIRRQGSTYIYDKSDPQDPVFYQLDGWHEWKHPWHWSKDFQYEAENYESLFSYISYNFFRKTERPGSAGDFSEFTTYLTLDDDSGEEYDQDQAPEATYIFHPRDIANQDDLYFWLKARSRTGQSTGIFLTVEEISTGNIILDTRIRNINQTNWDWYEYDLNANRLNITSLNREPYKITIKAENGFIEIDEFQMLTDDSRSPPARMQRTETLPRDQPFVVAPNPSTGKVFATWEMESEEASQIELWDVNGRKLQEFSVEGKAGKMKIDLEGYNPGLYLLVLRGKKGEQFVRKVVRQ